MSCNWRAWLKQLFRGNPEPGKSRPRPRVRLGVEVLEDRCCPRVDLMQSFLGMNFNTGSGSPPDPILAAGPSSIISGVNTSIQIQSKTGVTVAAPEDFSVFFAKVMQPGDSFSDPIIAYDDLAGRFYVGVLELPPSNGNVQIGYLDFAVSKNSNPTDFSAKNWTELTQIQSVDEGQDFPDQPHLGYTSDAVILSFNNFDPAQNVHNVILSMSKSALLSSTPLVQNTNYFLTNVATNMFGNGDHRALTPAPMVGDQTGTVQYFVQMNTDLTVNKTSTINVIAMRNYLSTAPTLTTTTFKVDPFSAPTGVQQLVPQGGATHDRIRSAYWDNNHLVAAQPIAGSGSSQSNVRWYEFSTAGATPTLVQQGTIIPGPGIDTSYGGIAVNANGDIGLVYIQSSATQDPSVYITGRSAARPLGTMGTPVLVQMGVPGAQIGTRGGDYQGAVVDPSDGITFWVTGEYTFDSGSTDDWGTAIAQFSANQKFSWVNFVYQQLLNRNVDPAGLAYWIGLLNQGVPRTTIVLAIERSPEYLTDVVTAQYQEYLNRAPDLGGLTNWVNFLAAGGSIEQMSAGFAGSPEYYADHGSTPKGFVDALYIDVLGRKADAAGEAAWLQALSSGVPRQRVALGFLVSTEDYTNLVTATFNQMLGRRPSSTELSAWVQALQSGGVTNQQFLADVLGSAEEFGRWL